MVAVRLPGDSNAWHSLSDNSGEQSFCAGFFVGAGVGISALANRVLALVFIPSMINTRIPANKDWYDLRRFATEGMNYV